MDIAYALVPPWMSEMLWFGFWSGAAYLSLRTVRAYERRSMEQEQLGALRERIRSVEDAVEKVERTTVELVEAQRFTTRLLTERCVS